MLPPRRIKYVHPIHTFFNIAVNVYYVTKIDCFHYVAIPIRLPLHMEQGVRFELTNTGFSDLELKLLYLSFGA